MQTNKVYIIGDRSTGHIFNTSSDYFSQDISFSSLFPTRYYAEQCLYGELDDHEEEHYKIVPAEVVSFTNQVLEIRYEKFHERF